jgi:hypothetical protein
MKLMTKALQKRLPALYSQEQAVDPLVLIHYFNPYGGADWYITEGSPVGDDVMLFGLCDLGLGFPELGEVSLNELASLKVPPFGLGIERDLYWSPKPLSAVAREH